MAKQNEVWKGVKSQVDLKNRIPEIVEEITKKSKFLPESLMGTSSWWKESTGVGAFHFKGTFEGNPAVLKIQGVKPETSEVYMIQSFEKQNESKVIRPPHIFESFPWDENLGYEAFILEDVGQQTLINLPTNKTELDDFFEYYDEYRLNCLNTPWLEKPNVNSDTIKNKFAEWKALSHKLYPNHPLRVPEDTVLIDKAIEILIKNQSLSNLEFVHGHFSTKDLYKKGNEIILLSNLYWSWRPKYYDLVFGYHWFMYSLGGIKNMTEETVEEQRKLWLVRIEERAEDKKALKLVLLERATAGLNLDALNLDPTKTISKHLVGKTREVLTKLVEELY